MASSKGRTLRNAVALIAVLGCAHTDPGAPSDSHITGAFDPTPPIRLTLNPGQDHWPAWTADGQGIWYAFEDLDRSDRDQCLGQLPAAGGTRSISSCHDAPVAASDSLDVVLSPTARGDRIAWVRINSPISSVLPDGGDIVVASTGALATPTSVRHFPFVSPSGTFQSFGIDLQWLDDSTLAYVGVQMMYNSISRDTTIAGLEVTLVHLGAGAPTVSVVGGTTGAASLAVGATAGRLYFTRDGDSRIFELQLPDTTVLTAFDFGGIGTARDVSVQGSRMLAVVGGPDALGGTIYLVAGGSALAVTMPGTFWRHPALRPDGRAFAAEGYDTATATYDIFTDTVP
jgi:hypothetical protein